jgi:murein peptide amidase A
MRRLAFLLGLVAVAAAGWASLAGAGSADGLGRRTYVVGRSVDGRAITAIETGDLDSPRRALVVGCVHGNECAGIAVAERLARMPPPPGLDLWVVPDLNPDGAAAGRRGNARGVDLNRNAPWRWRDLEGVFFSGERPLSEPETRAIVTLISGLRPTTAIWFHQRRDVVDESGGSLAAERRFAVLTGLRLGRLPREPGSLVGWENHEVPSGTAFVVELPAGRLGPVAAARYARAVLAVSRRVPLDAIPPSLFVTP